MSGDVQKQVGDQLNGITESAFFFSTARNVLPQGIAEHI